MSDAQVYPSFDNLIDKPTSIMYRPEEGIVVGMGQLVVDNEVCVISERTASEDYTRALDQLYPFWRQEIDLLKSPNPRTYSEQIVGITRGWANTHIASQFFKVKYIPPGYEDQWKESQQKKIPPQKHYVNPLCINGKFALIGIKVKETDKFRVAFCKIDGTVKGFYRSSSLELEYIANACFIGNTNAGFVATAKCVFHFKIDADLTLRVLWSIDNPTYPLFKSENMSEALAIMYPELVMYANENLLLVARYGEPFYIVNLKHVDKITKVDTQTTSLSAYLTEISCGTADGQLQNYVYTLKPGGAIKARLRAKKTRTMSKEWKLHTGAVVPVQKQAVQAHFYFKHHTVAALENAYILSNWNSSFHALVHNVESIVCLALIGDLVVALSSSYNLFFTQLVQSVPVKRDPLYKDTPPAPRGRQLLYADPNMICVLAPNGEIVQTLLPK